MKSAQNITFLLSFAATTTALLSSTELRTGAANAAFLRNKSPLEPSVLTSALASSPDQSDTLEFSQAIPFTLRPKNLQGYVGDVGFDPLYISERASMNYLRAAELKHGRIASAAWAGWVAVDVGFRFNGLGTSSSADAFLALVPKTAMQTHPDGFWYEPLTWAISIITLFECLHYEDSKEWLFDENQAQQYQIGDFGWDANLLSGKSAEYIEDMKLKELKNVRLGMLAFAGTFVQAVVVGAHEFPYMSGF